MKNNLSLLSGIGSEALITAEDMPVEEDPGNSEQPELVSEAGSDAADVGSGEDNTGDATAHDTIVRHDMLIQRDDLQKYLQARPAIPVAQQVV